MYISIVLVAFSLCVVFFFLLFLFFFFSVLSNLLGEKMPDVKLSLFEPELLSPGVQRADS